MARGSTWCGTRPRATAAARSREARVPAVLEMLDIPYTGSDPLTLAATLDKDCAKRLVADGRASPRRPGCCSTVPTIGRRPRRTGAICTFRCSSSRLSRVRARAFVTASVIADREPVAAGARRAVGGLSPAGAGRGVHRRRRADRGHRRQSARRRSSASCGCCRRRARRRTVRLQPGGEARLAPPGAL